jgi:hypothetical protein
LRVDLERMQAYSRIFFVRKRPNELNIEVR